MAARDCPGRKRRSAFGRDHPDSDGLSRAQPSRLCAWTISATMTPDEYDKLSPEERDIKDKKDRAREREEQTGIFNRGYRSDSQLSRRFDQLSPTDGNKILVRSILWSLFPREPAREIWSSRSSRRNSRWDLKARNPSSKATSARISRWRTAPGQLVCIETLQTSYLIAKSA